jgi:hypothetical protein
MDTDIDRYVLLASTALARMEHSRFALWSAETEGLSWRLQMERSIEW